MSTGAQCIYLSIKKPSDSTNARYLKQSYTQRQKVEEWLPEAVEEGDGQLSVSWVQHLC